MARFTVEHGGNSPTPGTDEARLRHCTCPGKIGERDRFGNEGYTVDSTCPLHGRPCLQSPVALIDMDGTVADFDGAMAKELKRLASPGEPTTMGPDGRYVELSYIRARRRLVRSRPGFWRSLPKYRPGFEILGELKALGFRCHVLTKGPAHEPAGWAEKVEWCRRHLPDMPILITEDKSLVYGKVLVDDWPDYFLSWLAHRPRGLVVAPAHPWNATTAHPQVVRYDGKNLTEVRERLRQTLGIEDEEP